MHILIYLYVCIYFLLLSFQNFGLCFGHHIWDKSLGFCYKPLGQPYNLKRKDSLVLQKEVSHNLCMKIYGKGCCLVKINMHMTSKGIYKLIDLKRRNCSWTKDKHEKQMPPPPKQASKDTRSACFVRWCHPCCCEVVSNFGMPSTKCFWNPLLPKKDSQSPQFPQFLQ
jgi:hypothetical protein